MKIIIAFVLGLTVGAIISSLFLKPAEVVQSIDKIECTITTEDRERAQAIITEGIYNHQWYIDNLEYQNASTGNTSVNQQWVNNYNFLKSLLVREGEK